MPRVTDREDRAAQAKAEIARRERLAKARAERERRRKAKEKAVAARVTARRDMRSSDTRDVAAGRGPKAPVVKRQQEADRRAALSRKIPTLTSAKTERAPRLTRNQELELAVDAVIDREPAFEESAWRTKPRHLEYVLGPSAATPGPQKGDVLDIGLAVVPGRVLNPLRAGRAATRGASAARAGEGAVKAAVSSYKGEGVLLPAAKRGVRSLRAGDKTQQLPRARSRVTQAVIERPADAVSRALMGEGKVASTARRVPGIRNASAERRVAKHAGREQRQEAVRKAADMRKHERALPKEGSPEDIAHYWYAQLPESQRNADGLRLVRGKQAEELEEVTSGRALNVIKARIAAVRAKMREAEEGERFALMSDMEELRLLASDLPNRADDIARSLAQLDSVIGKSVKADVRVIAAVRAFSEDRERVLTSATALKPERAAERKGLVSRWANSESKRPRVEEITRPRTLDEAKARIADIEDRLDATITKFVKSGPFDKDKVSKAADSPRRREAQRIARSKNVQRTREGVHPETLRDAYGGPSYAERTRQEAQVQMEAQVDRLLAKNPDHPVLRRFKDEMAELDALKRAVAVEAERGTFAEGLTDDAGAALGDVTESLLIPGVNKPGLASGEEVYIGHRLGGKVRGSNSSLMPISSGTGRARTPQGVGRENKLVLASTGRLRPSTHVAAEDWRAAQTYQSALVARDDLAQMGKPFSGRIPEGHVLVNPKGRAVPAHMKDERLAKLVAGDEDEIRAAAEEIVQGFISDDTNYKAMLAGAEKAGVQWDELRVVPKELVDRYYGQFTPARSGGKIAATYDAAIDFTAASIVFARLGYIPKGIAGNLVMAVPHQGPFLLVNAPRAGQVLRNTELRDLIGAEVGVGATATLAKEARYAQKARGIPSKIAHGVGMASDTPLRISAFIHEAAAAGVIPKFKAVLDEADEASLMGLLTDPSQRDLLNDIRSRSVEAMADFSRLTPTQSRWMRRFLVVPGWLYAGSRYPFHFAATHPGRTAAIGYAVAGMPYADKLGLPQTPALSDYSAQDVPHYAEGIETPLGVLRTGSISSVSTPWELGAAALQRSPRTVADVANPFAASAYNIAGRKVTYPGGSYQTDFGTALGRNLERLAPNIRLARDLISPDGEGAYPEDASRLGRFKRELGVVPIEIAREAGGSDPARRIVRDLKSEKQDVLAGLKQRSPTLLRENPGVVKRIETAYTRKQAVDLMRRDVEQDTEPGLEREQEKLRRETALLRKWGVLSPKKAAEIMGAARNGSEDDVRQWRDTLRTEGFENEYLGLLREAREAAGVEG